MRYEGKVICQDGADRIRQELADEAAQERESAIKRYEAVLATLNGDQIRRSPDLIVEHRMAAGSDGDLSADELARARIGGTCKRHGAGCSIREVSRYGKLIKKPFTVTCSMPVWQLPLGVLLNAGKKFLGNVTIYSTRPVFAPNMFVVDTLDIWAQLSSQNITTYE